MAVGPPPVLSPQYSAAPPGYVLAPHFQYGNFIVRFFAAVIDDFIVGALTGATVLLIGLVGSLFGMVAGRDSGSGLVGGFFAVLLFAWPAVVVVVVGYFVKMETGPGQATLGKRMLGLKVVNKDGGRISFGQSLGRFFVKWLISDVFFMLGYLMAAFTEKRQALHDMAAGTLVIEAR